MKVLVPTDDHRYRFAYLKKVKVVHNKKTRSYFEYVGDEYLQDGEEVVEMDVAE